MPPTQMTLGLNPPDYISSPVRAAIEQLALESRGTDRGAVFTRREVVDFILDLAGYKADRPLHEKRLLEPSFGGGDFLLPVVERLLAAWRAAGFGGSATTALGDAIRAVELHHDTFRDTHAAVVALLMREGLKARAAKALADGWLTQGDFLWGHWRGNSISWWGIRPIFVRR